MNKTFRTFLTGLLAFSMIFASIMPMMASETIQTTDEVQMYRLTMDTFTHDLGISFREVLQFPIVISGDVATEYDTISFPELLMQGGFELNFTDAPRFVNQEELLELGMTIGTPPCHSYVMPMSSLLVWCWCGQIGSVRLAAEFCTIQRVPQIIIPTYVCVFHTTHFSGSCSSCGADLSFTDLNWSGCGRVFEELRP